MNSEQIAKARKDIYARTYKQLYDEFKMWGASNARELSRTMAKKVKQEMPDERIAKVYRAEGDSVALVIPDDVARWVKPGIYPLLLDCLEKKDWQEALNLAQSETRISLCFGMIRTGYLSMDDDQSPDLVATTISESDLPSRDIDTLHDLLSQYHEEKRRGFDGDAARKAYAELPETMTIYRGTVEAEPEDKRGVCWTLDRKKAVWFATEHGRFRVTNSPPVVLTATVNRDDIFALLLERNEQEVLVHPEYLGDVAAELL